MSTATHEPSSSSLITPDHPEFGEIAMRDVVLSQVAYWREGELHVFRSTEYDVIAAHEDEHTAVQIFVEKAEDYAEFLSDPDGEPTVDDLRIANLIIRRLLTSYEQTVAVAARRRKVVRILRGRGHDALRGWHHNHPARQT